MIKNYLKGLIIGCAKIIPGVSGSVLAISLNVYFRCLEIINNFYRVNKRELKYFFPIFFGVLSGVLLFSSFINSVYKENYLMIILLFAGFIIGETHKEVSVNIKKDILFYIPTIFLFFALPYFDVPKLNFNNEKVLYVVLGIIEAVTMIIPGISGTAILIALDLYDIYLNFIVSLTDINFFISNIRIIGLYSVSLILGGYFTIKVIINLYKKNSYLSSIIRSLMMITIFMMLKEAVLDVNFDFSYIVVFILGFVISSLFNKIINKRI